MPKPSAISEFRLLANQLPVPPGCDLLAFGSSLHGEEPDDLDVLIVYDPTSRAAAVWLRKELEQRAELGLVDVTMLTIEEEAQAGFVKEVAAVHIAGGVVVANGRTTD